LIAAAEEPIIFQRLYRIWQEQSQHRLLLNAEDVKKCIGANSTNTVELILQNESFDLALSARELESICESEIKRIEIIVLSALEVRDVARPSTRVFLTGGMSLCSGVVEAIHRIFPEGTMIRRISSLQSVAAGLAVAARHLSLTENFLSDNENVRGIPITK
jgi:molecular chaperone DnaK (HSP70)